MVALVCASCSFQHGNPLAGGGSADAPGGSGDGAPAGWWDPAWPYRMPLAIEDSVALATGFQVGFSYDLDAAPCAGSRDGVRVVWQDTELARVIDEVGAPQWIWFQLGAPLAANTVAIDYWLYCGNPSPTTAALADPTQVFDFYDDFAGSGLGSAWIASGSGSESGGAAHVPNGSTFRSVATYGPGTATDFSMAPQAGENTMYFWGGFQNGSGTAAPWLLWNTRNEAGIHPEVMDTQDNLQPGDLHPFDTSFQLYGVENYGTSSRYRLADVDVGTITHDSDITTSISVRFDDYSSGSNAIEVNMARVRKAVDPPPTVTVGAPQMLMP